MTTINYVNIYSVDGRQFNVQIDEHDTIGHIKCRFAAQHYITLDDCDLYTLDTAQLLLPDTWTLQQFNLARNGISLVARLHVIMPIPVTPAYAVYDVVHAPITPVPIYVLPLTHQLSSVSSTMSTPGSTTTTSHHNNIFDDLERSLSREHSKQRIADMLSKPSSAASSGNRHNLRVQKVREKLTKSMTAPLNQLSKESIQQLAEEFDGSVAVSGSGVKVPALSLSHSHRQQLHSPTSTLRSYDSTTPSLCHSPHSVSHSVMDQRLHSGSTTPLPRQSSCSIISDATVSTSAINDLTEQLQSTQSDIVLLQQRSLREREATHARIAQLQSQVQLVQNERSAQEALLTHQRAELNSTIVTVEAALTGEHDKTRQLISAHEQQLAELQQQLQTAKSKLANVAAERDTERVRLDKAVHDMRIQIGATYTQKDLAVNEQETARDNAVTTVVELLKSAGLADTVAEQLQRRKNDGAPSSAGNMTSLLSHVGVAG